MTFHIFGVPVSVSPFFWVVAGLVGIGQGKPLLAVGTVVILFLGVLVHELGHALVGRLFGATPAITIHAFGGTTAFRSGPLTRWRSALTALAGPFAGAVAGLIVLAVFYGYPGLTEEIRDVLRVALFCTFGWSALNLIPVLPLDGGVILKELLGPQHLRATLIISAILGGTLTAVCMSFGLFLLSMIFAMSTLRAAQAAWSHDEVVEAQKQRSEFIAEQVRYAQRNLSIGRYAQAEEVASILVEQADEAPVRDDCRRILASIAIERSQGQNALDWLDGIEIPLNADDVLRAQALDVSGDREGAFILLQHRVQQDPTGPALEALLRGLVATIGIDAAVDLGRSYSQKGAIDALLWLAREAAESGRISVAVELLDNLVSRTHDGNIEAEAKLLRAKLAAS